MPKVAFGGCTEEGTRALGRYHFLKMYLLIMCVHTLAHVSISSPEDQKKASDPLDLELLVVLRHPVWVLGTKLGFSFNL